MPVMMSFTRGSETWGSLHPRLSTLNYNPRALICLGVPFLVSDPVMGTMRQKRGHELVTVLHNQASHLLEFSEESYSINSEYARELFPHYSLPQILSGV